MDVRSEFEKYLKESNYLADVIQTHRIASSEVIATFVSLLIKNNQVSPVEVIETLKTLELSTGRISIDSERRILTSTIRETLQSKK